MNYKLYNNKCYPSKGQEGDAGYDLRSAINIYIPPCDYRIIPLGIGFEIPSGWYGMLTHRSSLAFKGGSVLSLGIIDSNFTNEISALVFNHSNNILRIDEGDRIAQIIFMEYKDPIPLKEKDELHESKDGFGSSGK